jgi:pyrrolysine biosynthesis protein PylD
LTRLKTSDICQIRSGLERYNQALLSKTGRGLLGIACHAHGKDEVQVQALIEGLTVLVVPITAGEGVISDFSETVAAILGFLGVNARVSEHPDASGVALAFESKAAALMMADDHRFVGINLNNGRVADNSRETGRVFAAALDLMARGIKGKQVLVMGCGPVGESAAKALLLFGARVALFDIDIPRAGLLKQRLLDSLQGNNAFKENISIEAGSDFSSYSFILEATPCAETISDDLIGDDTVIVAPGVPVGVSNSGCQRLQERFLHDKLELGVAAMAISLLS